MENGSVKTKGTIKRSAEELFNKFVETEDCPEILQTFQRLVNSIGIVAETPREFYHNLKSKLQTWKCKSLWELLDVRANQKEYSKGTVCEDIHVLVIGCGPIGLRTAIELALLGAQVVIVEKRKTFSRNNVLHLWPFLLTDFRSLGAKKFYGKFCSGSIDHISIRRLQAILLKAALILGVKVFTGVTFEKLIEPTNEDEGWKCHVTPFHDSLTEYEVDVVIGADGKKNVLPGFAQIEMRGTLAIGITANFVNHFSEAETKVGEISGIAYQFNPAFFDNLKQQKGIQLENIVYYKDETHYFVMTAVKSSLLKRGVLKKDYGNKPQKLLNNENVDKEKLISYVHDAVTYATKGQLINPELKRDNKNNADIAVFDFTSIKKAENSARIIERKGHKLLIGLVGDSLLEPFWPTGSGCARGVLSALDAAWMVRSFAQDKPPLQILSERENIYRLLSGTSNENMHKTHALYTINPSSRYLHIPQKKIQEVYHLYETDDPVNADFSFGSPTGMLAQKGSRKKRISTAAKPQYRHHRKHIKFATHASLDSTLNMTSPGSSMEDITFQGTPGSSNIDNPKARQRLRTVSEGMTSGGEEVHEIIKDSKWGKRAAKKTRSPLSPINHDNHKNMTKMASSESAAKTRSKKQKIERMVSSPSASASIHQEKAHKRRSFFGFGRGRAKSRTGKKSPTKTPDKLKHQSTLEEKIVATKDSKVEKSEGGSFPTNDTPKREIGAFSRNHPMRRSARDIIAEIEARNSQDPEAAKIRAGRKHSAMSLRDRSLEENRTNLEHKASVKPVPSDSDMYTTPKKQSKTEDIWEELARMSPCAKGAVPALSNMSPEHMKQNAPSQAHGDHHDIPSAMRIAGLMALATPLLINEQGFTKKEIPWYSRNVGRVKSAISKYDSLNGKRLTAVDGTPLRAPSDRFNDADRKPTLAEVAKRIMSEQKANKNGETDRGETGEEAMSWQPTAIAFVEGKTDPNAISNQAMAVSRQQEMEKLRFLEGFSSLDQESTDSPTKKDFSSPIYQRTFIADMKSNGPAKPEAPNTQQLGLPRNYAQEGEWRNTPVLAKKEMERLMQNLTETISKERAEASIRFLISMFRRIQRNPKEDKFRRIFKSRVKFKKHVWTVRNAKMFMLASGWIEVGSFLLFPVEKNVREPLSVLNKHLGLLVSGSTVQISTIKSTPRRGSSTETPKQLPSKMGSLSTSKDERSSPFKFSRMSSKNEINTSDSKPPQTPKTPSRTESNKDLSQHGQEIPRGEAGSSSSKKETPLDKRFSRSVPLNLNVNDWDLEMEDPLEEVSVDISDKNANSIPRRMATSSLERRAPTIATTPDVAIIEEIDELSNTLDDLMESLEDMDPASDDEKKVALHVQAPKDIKDLCTTLDYMLDSSEEEELDKDLKSLDKEMNTSDETISDIKRSAFTKVVTPQSSLHGMKNIINEEDNVKGPLQAQTSRPYSSGNKTKTETKQTSRRKLPKPPDEKDISKKECRKPALTTSKSMEQPASDKALHRQISQESLSIIRRRFGIENEQTSKSSSAVSKETDNKAPLPKRAQSKTMIQKNANMIHIASLKNTTNKSEKTKNNLKISQGLSKSQSCDSVGSFQNSSVTKPRTFSENHKESLSRENSNTESISSIDSVKINGLPPSGLERTRSARARRRQAIASKLECLETSYDSLEHSPNKTSSKTSSASSSTSTSSSRTKPSGVTTGPEQKNSSRSLPRNGVIAKRPSSRTARQSSTSSVERHEENGTVFRDDGRAAGRTGRSASNASLGRKKTDSRKKDQENLLGLSKNTSMNKTDINQNQRKPLRRSNAVDTSMRPRASSNGSERSSIKTKRRKLPSTNSKTKLNLNTTNTNGTVKTSISHDNNGKSKEARKNNTTKSKIKKSSSKNGPLQTHDSSTELNDSFDSIIVIERSALENAVKGDIHLKDFEKNYNDTEKMANDQVRAKGHLTPTTKRSKDLEEPGSGSSQIFDDKESKNVDKDLKVEFKLQDTSSWMVLDYEGVNKTSIVKNVVPENNEGNQTPLAEHAAEEEARLKGNEDGGNIVEDAEDVTKSIYNSDFVTDISTSERVSEKDVGLTEEDSEGNGGLVVDDGKTMQSKNHTIGSDNTIKITEKVMENGVLLTNDDEKDGGNCVNNGTLIKSGSHNENDGTTNECEISLQNGFVYTDGNSTIDLQDAILQFNGTVSPTKDNIQGNEIIRRKAFRKPKSSGKGYQKPSKTKSQSMNNLSVEKRNITFAISEDQQITSPPSPKVESSTKETKQRSHKPFGLRRKKIGQSCPDINKSSQDNNLDTVPSIISSSLNSSTSLLDKSVDKTSPANKSSEKKKLSPFKLLTRKKKSPEKSSLKNT